MNSDKKQLKTTIDETVLCTPKPRASSTIQKQYTKKKVDLIRIPLTYNLENSKTPSPPESLHILSADNNRVGQRQFPHQSQITNTKLQQQRCLVNSILEKTTGLGLPSKYLRPSNTFDEDSTSFPCDSTVNETDLLESKKDKLLFKPDEVSTPRSSQVSSKISSSQNSIPRASISKSLMQLSQQIQNNSDISLAKLCNEFCDFTSSLNFNHEVDEESFVSGELANAKITEQEQLWQRKMDVLGGHEYRMDSMFSIFSNCERQQSMSFTEFFQKKSELAELCLKDSPEKQVEPTPLIDKSSLEEESIEKSVFGMTDLENAILLEDDTQLVMDLIGKVATKKTSKSNGHEKQKRSNLKENINPLTNLIDNLNLRSSSAEPLRHHFKNATETITRPNSAEPRDPKHLSKEGTYLDNSNFIHTASSLESLPGGKLPVSTNRIELVWGSVRVGNRKTQTFILRNKSHNKLRLQISSSNICFRILSNNSDLESVSVLSILMYPSESRLFSIVFIPTSVGAIVGRLNFTPVSSELQSQQIKKQQLMMYGYGGHSNFEIQNVLKDTNMKMWLSLGKIDNKLQLSQQFVVKNLGSVAAFGLLKFISKALYGCSKVSICPTELVLNPKDETTVWVTYTPSKEDAKHLFAMTGTHIIEIGIIQIISGAEQLRGRIRRLYKKLKQEAGCINNPLVEELSKKFPNEIMPTDLNRFTETVGCMKELMQNFDSKEISLTLEKDSEQTLVGQIGGIDETSMFQSLCEGMSTVLMSKTQVGSCTVEPTSLVLTPIKSVDCVLVSSQSTTPLHFEITVMPTNLLTVAPQEGILRPGEIVLLSVSYDIRKIRQQTNFKLQIYMDDDVFEVDIKVILLTGMVNNLF